MIYELLNREDFLGLPTDKGLRFVELEEKCRRRMNELIAREHDGHFAAEIKGQYMTIISALGQECGVPHLNLSGLEWDEGARFDRFFPAVIGEVARIQFRTCDSGDPVTVQLQNNTKRKIEWHVSHLRDVVQRSSLTTTQKSRLNGRLDQLVEEIDRPCSSFGVTMAALVAITALMSNATTIAAEGHTAITQIMKLIGIDKDTEDAARLRLAPPLKALPAPSTSTTAAAQEGGSAWDSPGTDLDEEIPF